MAVFNQTSCGIRNGNRGDGSGSCFTPKIIDSAVLIPKGTAITQADANDIATYLNSKSTSDNIKERFVMLTDFVNIEDKTSDAVVHTYSDGSTITIRENPNRFVFEMRITDCVYNSLRNNFNDRQGLFDIIFFDKENKMIGWSNDNYETIRGFDLNKIYVSPRKLATNDAPTMYHIEFELSYSWQFNDKLAFIALEYPVYNYMSSVNDITIVPNSVVAGATTASVYLRTICGNLDMLSLFPSIGTNTTLWNIKRSTGSAITISSSAVSQNASGQKYVTLTLGTALDVGSSIALAPISVLSAQSISYYESNTLIVKQ